MTKNDTTSHTESTSTTVDYDDRQEIADEEIRAVRQRLKAALKREMYGEESSVPPPSGFWRQPATQWDIVKWLISLALPLLVGCALWAVRIEVNQAKTDARFDAITVTLTQQSETLKGINATLKDVADSRLQGRERLASIEAKVDILTQRSDSKP